MNKIVWCCWLQGRYQAPWLVERCLSSWEARNRDWEVRCLDREALASYIDFPDLTAKEITPAATSDIARILLLRRYGGVWADATAFCNRPLDEWLGAQITTGFFAFDQPGGGRMLSSWFLASEPENLIVDRWCDATIAYWAAHGNAHDYFWFHQVFAECYRTDPRFAAAWDRVPKRSAIEPHAIQNVGPFENLALAHERVDWECPVFKLTYRLDQRQCVKGTLLAHLLGPAPHAT